ncbi:MAG: UDP-N-acetylmuramoyl-tripeptide--D-alanyl-D-alanine ligase [Candidatus Brocadiaceae bacterium]|nr:UDP-N-acetylmuramoyl-tripeptide--D-alanyl-D-alanine ligase [Candidatus Brocadiaceae bacterium]
METLFLDEVVKAIHGQVVFDHDTAAITGVSTDSRTICEGDLYFALKGNHFDGHRFIVQAKNAGARGAIVSDENIQNRAMRNFFVIKVNDTTTALGDLAGYYRSKLNTKIIGITGSNGKTTTKEMTYCLLSKFGSVVKPEKSFNNYIGVPITIFEMENMHTYGILEMGTNAPGEIRRLSEIGSPDVAVITNISKTHLEGLKSIDGVAVEKEGIVSTLRGRGVFVYNTDNQWCTRISEKFKGEKVGFGFDPRSHIRCTEVKKKDTGYSFTINNEIEIFLPVPGYHNISNCLASFAVCHALGHNITKLANAFSSFKLPGMRIEQKNIGNVTIINDTYNANPDSVLAALQHLKDFKSGGRKIFICGDMLELGRESQLLHKEIGEIVARSNIDLLWTVGGYASEIAEAAKRLGMAEKKIAQFENVEDITTNELDGIMKNDVILVKGSRGMHMDRIVEKLEKFLLQEYTRRYCAVG